MSARPLRVTLFFLFTFLPASLSGRSGASYLIVEHPERLVAYNQYQQEATGAERQSLTPFVPLRILKSDALLADGFTRCMQVETEGKTFFLLLDKKGRPATSGPLGSQSTFRNSVVLSDSIEILRERTVQFSPIKGSARFLKKGERLVRVFRDSSRVYCRRNDGGAAYGWTDLAETGGRRSWRLLPSAITPRTGIPAGVAEKIQTRINETNQLLAQLFGYFNRETRQQKEAAHWDVEVSKTSITCVLNGTSGERFEQSTRYLVKDIENIVLGSNLAVLQSPGRIDIRPQ